MVGADVFLVATQEEVTQSLKRECPKRRRVWHDGGIPGEELLSPGGQVRLHDNLAAVAAVDHHRHVFDISQNPLVHPSVGGDMCPPMLRGSKFWSQSKHRLWLPVEYFLAQGIALHEEHGAGHAILPQVARQLMNLDAGETTQVVGNGMNVKVAGFILALVLTSAVEHATASQLDLIPASSRAARRLVEDGDGDPADGGDTVTDTDSETAPEDTDDVDLAQAAQESQGHNG